MKIKITAQFEDGKPFTTLIPKHSLNDEDATDYLNALDLTTKPSDNEATNAFLNSTSNGVGLSLATVTAELYDDFNTTVCESTRVKIALRRLGHYDNVIQLVLATNGENQLWWENAKTLDYTDSRIIAMASALSLTEADLKAVWKLALSID